MPIENCENMSILPLFQERRRQMLIKTSHKSEQTKQFPLEGILRRRIPFKACLVFPSRACFRRLSSSLFTIIRFLFRHIQYAKNVDSNSKNENILKQKNITFKLDKLIKIKYTLNYILWRQLWNISNVTWNENFCI